MDYIYKYLKGKKPLYTDYAQRVVGEPNRVDGVHNDAGPKTANEDNKSPLTSIREDSYRYTALTKVNEIRLLRFSLEGESFRCELIHTTLDDAPPYVALSYTWNPETTQQDAESKTEVQRRVLELMINGKYLEVSGTLAEAIRHRAADLIPEGYLFWVDAICVNQSDLQERSSHVLLMKSLYEKAVRVDVWLGMPADDSNLAIEQLSKWDNELRLLAKERNNDVYGAVASINPHNSTFFGPPGSDEFKAWGALYKLCLRPWWRRVWILQEATGPALTILYCGSRRLHWQNFIPAKLLSQQLATFPGLERMERIDSGNMFHLDVLRDARRAENRLPLQLLEALQETRRCECLDDRDRVYAAIGMCSGLAARSIIPSYHETTTVKKVYTEVVDNVLKHYPDGHQLDFLGYAVRTWDDGDSVNLIANDPTLPTWLPDWRNRIVLTPLAKSIDVGERKGKQVYSASKATKMEAVRKHDNLEVKGFVVNEVTSVLPGFEEWKSIENLWRPSNPQDAYPSGGTLETAYLHTIVLDVRRTNFSVHRRGYSVDWELLKTDPSVVDAERAEERYLMPGVFSTAIANRRMFWTSDGYVGMGPAAAKPGDKICCLFGGAVLYILRSKDQFTYEFIGECYVHGMMDGAAIDLGRETRTFVIV